MAINISRQQKVHILCESVSGNCSFLLTVDGLRTKKERKENEGETNSSCQTWCEYNQGTKMECVCACPSALPLGY